MRRDSRDAGLRCAAGAAISTTDSEYPADRDSGFNPQNVDLKFMMTRDIVKSAVASARFSRTFH
jgi:hypothetical protein